MAPADRKAMILSRAAEFFAEYGLTAQTRALAAACGVAQRLLYRYFPSKAALLEEVYQEAIVAPFRAVWLVQLKDRTRPVEQRLTEFYSSYYATVLTRKWMRLFLYASLAEVQMMPDHVAAIFLEMIETIVQETAHELQVELRLDREVMHEIGWMLHGAVSHFAIRRRLYAAIPAIPDDRVLALQVRMFLAGFAATVAQAGAAATNPTERPGG
ncbi:MAG: TetR/AcrR family transcriptional regulator [Xanthobacteraceae bacterium]|jgi:AcrR family transcriptional regulator